MMCLLIPISKPGFIITSLMLIAAVLWKKTAFEEIKKLKENKVVLLFALYGLLYPLSLLWTENTEWGLDQAKNALIFIVVPFVAIAAQRKYYDIYTKAFITGVTVTASGILLSYYDITHIDNASMQNHMPFMSHISTSVMLALAAFFAISHLITTNKRELKIFYAFVAAVLIFTLFIQTGRTGQITFFALMPLILFALKRNIKIGTYLAILASTTLIFLTISYTLSENFKQRANNAIEDISTYAENPRTSVGARISFYQNTYNLILTRAWHDNLIGAGVGDAHDEYTKSIDVQKYIPLVSHRGANGALNKFHSQYLFTLNAFGLLGIIVIFLLIFYLIKKATEEDNANVKFFQIGILIVFLLNMIVEESLQSKGLEALFVFFIAALFKNKPNENILFEKN